LAYQPLRASGGEAARRRSAGSGETLRARQIDKNKGTVLAARNLGLESGGSGEICAVKVRDTLKEGAKRNKSLRDDADRASLRAGLSPRGFNGVRRNGLRRLDNGVRRFVLLIFLSQTPAGVGVGVGGVDEESQEGQSEESNNTGDLHGGLLFGRNRS
jgi:hypothetical protein